jgi:dienelactone hydrolase
LGMALSTNSCFQCPLATGRHPLIIVLPGWGGKHEDNTALSENLASLGYIVTSMDDTSEPSRRADFSTDATTRGTVSWAEVKLRLASSQVRSLITALERENERSGSPLFGSLDTRAIGLIGFSFGGAVAAQTALEDSRVLAAVDMDGSMFGPVLKTGLKKPFLFMKSGSVEVQSLKTDASAEDRFDRENELQIRAGLERNRGYVLAIQGTGHYNFVDAALQPSIRHTGVGPADPREVFSVIITTVGYFFNLHLLHSTNNPPKLPDFATLHQFVSMR